MGSYRDWQTALKGSQSYESMELFNEIVTSTRAVLTGQAAYERDGVTFTESRPHLPLIAALAIAKKTERPLQIIDFGGSLGSAYLQNRNWLVSRTFQWIIIEQPHVVAAGRKLFDEHPV